jgi:alpha-mannosidase
MIFNTEGLPLQAITGGFGGDRRVEHILDMKARSFTHTVRGFGIPSRPC